MQKWLWSYVVAVVAVGLNIVVQNGIGFSKSDWAAWVPAIGSIGAIIGAFEVGRRQVESSRRHAMEMDRLARERKIGAIVAVAHHAVFDRYRIMTNKNAFNAELGDPASFEKHH